MKIDEILNSQAGNQIIIYAIKNDIIEKYYRAFETEFQQRSNIFIEETFNLFNRTLCREKMNT